MSLKGKRLSNIELLRIVAMLMVLGLHVNFRALGGVSFEEDIFSAFTRSFWESLCIGAVNVFVLISGWFGIKLNLRKTLAFLFQCLFFLLLLAVPSYFNGWRPSTTEAIRTLLFADLWFVPAYLGLMILAPVLNQYAENASKKLFITILSALFGFSTVFGFVVDINGFAAGYSTVFFINLYLLGRFIKRFPSRLTALPMAIDLLIFFGTVAITTILLVYCPGEHLRVIKYTSPPVIISALYIFLFFSKLAFHCQAINFLAASSFAVYLFHANPLVFNRFISMARKIYDANDGVCNIQAQY